MRNMDAAVLAIRGLSLYCLMKAWEVLTLVLNMVTTRILYGEPLRMPLLSNGALTPFIYLIAGIALWQGAARIGGFILGMHDWIGDGDTPLSLKSGQILLLGITGLFITVQAVPKAVILLANLFLAAQIGKVIDGSLYIGIQALIELAAGCILLFGGRKLSGWYRRITAADTGDLSA